MSVRFAAALPFVLALAACQSSGSSDADPAAAAGAANADAACEAAIAHVQGCFPDRQVEAPAQCNAEAAAALSGQSCDDLAAGKADSGWGCLWAPWLCVAGGGSSTGGSSANADGVLEVAVDQCGTDITNTGCAYVTSVSCALVVVEKGSKEVARAYTSGGGRVTFEGLEKGEYTVKVLARDGGVAKADFGDYTENLQPAEQPIALDGGETPWARFNLAPGEGDEVQACVRYDGKLTVKDDAGDVVDRHETEWSWVVAFDRGDEVFEYTRPLFMHNEATSSGKDENVFAFFEVFPGEHTVRFIRVDIPESARRPNPDYERLVRLYAVDGVEPILKTIKIKADDVPGDVTGRMTIADPLL